MKLAAGIFRLAATSLLFIPLGFASPGRLLTAYYLAVLTTGSVLAAWRAATGDRSLAILLGTLSVLFIFSATNIGLPIGSVVLPLQLLTGYMLGALLPAGKARLVFSLVALQSVLVISLAVDAVSGRHVYLQRFPATHVNLTIDSSAFRASGIIGQPIPAAFVGAGLAMSIWILSEGTARPQLIRSIALLTASLTLWLTGTRSALICVTISSLLYGISRLFTPRRRRSRPASLFATAGLLVGMGVSLFAVSSGSRLLDFSNLEGTQSFIVRSNALSVVSQLQDQCFACVIVGHGHGALQDELRLGYAVDNLSTLDNQFLSAYWDYGILGIGLLLLVGILSFKSLRRSETEPRAGACFLLILFFGSFFFEPFYISVTTILIGACIGVALAPGHRAVSGVSPMRRFITVTDRSETAS